MKHRGWHLFSREESVARWAEHAAGLIHGILSAPENAEWFRGESTWFVGVDCLPNDTAGRLPDGPALSGRFQNHVPEMPLHRAQLSVVFPGYPRPIAGESEGATRYRRNRDGAHVDGLLPVGPDRRRKVLEPHAYILGVPLTNSASKASPLVVWDGSHDIMRSAFERELKAHPPESWSDADLTEVYQHARAEVFASCRRVELPVRVGETILLHPMLVHGIAPWSAADVEPRAVAYFRPMTDIATWLAGTGVCFPVG